MQRWRTLVSVIALSVGVVTLIMIRYKTNSESGFKFARTYASIDLDLVKSIPLPFNAAEMKFLGNRLFLLDGTDMRIIEVDLTSGVIKDQPGHDVRVSPFELIISWDVDDSGIYVFDQRKQTLALVNFSGRIEHVHAIEVPFNRAHRLTAGRYLIKCIDRQETRRQIFELLNDSLRSIRKVRYPIPAVDNEMSLDGFFLKGWQGQSFYICHWAGYFFSIDSTGKFLYGRDMIDKSPPPEIIEERGRMSMDPKAKLVNPSAAVWGNDLFVLSRARGIGDDPTDGLVDVYSTKNGEYEFSLRIPLVEGKTPRAISVHVNNLYTLQGDRVVCYRIRGYPSGRLD